MKKISAVLLGLIIVLLVLFLVQPAPISPLAYHPLKAAAMTGTLLPNTALQQADILADGAVDGPEEIAVDVQGRLYAGTADGRIMRWNQGQEPEVFSRTGGRPLGLKFDSSQNLIVCDAFKGLLSIDTEGRIETLAVSAEGLEFKFTNALDIAEDGSIYFTDASYRYSRDKYLYDLMEARPYGRFMRYDPGTQTVSVLLNDLYFANGVALSENEDFVLINETYRYRIVRYWLKGPHSGKKEVFIDNLPGFPDNISRNSRGRFWLALFTVRNPLMDRLHSFPFLKTQLSKLPPVLWPKPKPYGLVLELDARGRIVQSLHDPTGKHLKEITSAVERDGFLYLGSLDDDRVGRYRLQ